MFCTFAVKNKRETMSYTITINPDCSPLAFSELKETLDYKEIGKAKEPKKIALSADIWDEEDWGIPPDDMEFLMGISRKINKNIANRVAEDFNLPYKTE